MKRTLILFSPISVFFGGIVLLTPIVRAKTPDTPNWTRALVWSPDGTRLAIATQYGSIQLIDQNGQIISTLQAENDIPVLALAWSPSSLYLASGGLDNLVTIWDVTTSDAVGNYQSEASVNGLSWHPNGIYLAFASANATLKNAVVWDTVTGETVFATPASETFSVAWSPDGSLLAISKFGEIQVWDPFLTPGQLVRVFDTQPHNILFLDWKSDGTRLASAQTNTPDQSVVNVWDTSTGQLMLSYMGHTDAIRTVVWSPDGSYLASASLDGTVRIWDSVNGQTLETFQGNGKMLSVDWNPDGTKVVYGNEGGFIEIRDVPLPSSCTATISAGDVPGLIAAINAANANADPDTLCLAAGTFTLNAVDNKHRSVETAAECGWVLPLMGVHTGPGAMAFCGYAG